MSTLSTNPDGRYLLNADDSTGSIGTLTVGVSLTSPLLASTGPLTVTSTSASALAVGRLGATTPAFSVDASTSSQAAGLKVTGATTTGTVAVETIGGAAVNLTINAKGTGTIGIGSVSTGAVTITPATTVTGALTTTAAHVPTGGIAAAGGFAISPRGLHTGNQTVTQTTDGNDTTPSVTETYICEVYVPYNCTITGVALFNGSVAAGNITVKLANSSGVPVGTQSASTAMSGTDAFQLIPLGATYAAVGPATYLVLAQYDNTSARFNTHIMGAFGASKKTSEVYGTFTTVTAPTTFTTAVGPIASLY